jgi:hypothetical protein
MFMPDRSLKRKVRALRNQSKYADETGAVGAPRGKIADCE